MVLESFHSDISTGPGMSISHSKRKDETIPFSEELSLIGKCIGHEILVYSLNPDCLVSDGLFLTIKADLAAEMPNYKLPEYLEAKPETVTGTKQLIVCYHKTRQRIVGVITGSLYTSRHFEYYNIVTILISTQLQKTKLTTIMLRYLFESIVAFYKQFPRYFAIKTLNPVSYCMMRTFARVSDSEMYPVLENVDTSSELSEIAKIIAGQLSGSLIYDADISVIRNASGGVPDDFYVPRPLSKDPMVNAFFNSSMAPADRMLCVIDLKDEERRTKVKRSVGCAN